MGSTVSEGPKGARSFSVFRPSAEQPRTDAEQYSPPQTETLGLLTSPRKLLEERKPRVFELRQLLTANASAEQLARNSAEPRLARRR